ncbi:MAG: thermonuclease family protein [Proteobacteria bacterium]|nr:thermonuclease family protein [Pseudomonadota bacterium]
MKRALLFLSLFSLLCAPAMAKTKQPPKNTIGGPVDAVVEYVTDGDTFSAMVELKNGGEITVRVRILEIDAPEMNGQCQSETDGAIAAKERLAELLPLGKRIRLYDVKDDKYLGRIDAIVKDYDGRNIGEVMLDEKFARPYAGHKRQSWCE